MRRKFLERGSKTHLVFGWIFGDKIGNGYEKGTFGGGVFEGSLLVSVPVDYGPKRPRKHPQFLGLVQKHFLGRAC